MHHHSVRSTTYFILIVQPDSNYPAQRQGLRRGGSRSAQVWLQDRWGHRPRLQEESAGLHGQCEFHHSPEPVSNNNSRPSPFQGIYVTEVHESSASAKAGLRIHDKILQCNGYDFTMVRSLSSDILKYNISFLCR